MRREFRTESGTWTLYPGFAIGDHDPKVYVTVYADGRPAVVSIHTNVGDLSGAVQIARNLVVEGSLALNEAALADLDPTWKGEG